MRKLVKALVQRCQTGRARWELLQKYLQNSKTQSSTFHINPIHKTSKQLHSLGSLDLPDLVQFFKQASAYRLQKEQLLDKKVVGYACRLMERFDELGKKQQLQFVCFLKSSQMTEDARLNKAVQFFLQKHKQEVAIEHFHLFLNKLEDQVLKLLMEGNSQIVLSILAKSRQEMKEGFLQKIKGLLLKAQTISQMLVILTYLPKIQQLYAAKQDFIDAFLPRIFPRLQFISPAEIVKLIYVNSRFYFTPRLQAGLKERAAETLGLFTFRELSQLLQVLEGNNLDQLYPSIKANISRSIGNNKKSAEVLSLISQSYERLVLKFRQLGFQAQRQVTDNPGNHTPILETVQTFLYQYDANQLKKVAWALANDTIITSKHLNPFLKKLVQILETRLNQFNTQQMATFAWTLFKRGRPHKVLLRVEECMVRQVKERGRSKDAALLVWAFVRNEGLKWDSVRTVMQCMLKNIQTLEEFQYTMAGYLVDNLTHELPAEVFLQELRPAHSRLLPQLSLENQLLMLKVYNQRLLLQAADLDHFLDRFVGLRLKPSREVAVKTVGLLTSLRGIKLGKRGVQALQKAQALLNSYHQPQSL